MRCFDFGYIFNLQMCGFEACNSSNPGLLSPLPVELYEAAISGFDIYEILCHYYCFYCIIHTRNLANLNTRMVYTLAGFFSLKNLRK